MQMKTRQEVLRRIKALKSHVQVVLSVLDDSDDRVRYVELAFQREIRPLEEKLERARHRRENRDALVVAAERSLERLRKELRNLKNADHIKKLQRVIERINELNGVENTPPIDAVVTERYVTRDRILTVQLLIKGYENEIRGLETLTDRLENELSLRATWLRTRHFEYLLMREQGWDMINAAHDEINALTELAKRLYHDERIQQLLDVAADVERLTKELEA
jgi:hypothetical protein